MFTPHYRPWSAFRAVDYGYTRMQIINATHLYMEQVSDEKVTIEIVYNKKSARYIHNRVTISNY